MTSKTLFSILWLSILFLTSCSSTQTSWDPLKAERTPSSLSSLRSTCSGLFESLIGRKQEIDHFAHLNEKNKRLAHLSERLATPKDVAMARSKLISNFDSLAAKFYEDENYIDELRSLSEGFEVLVAEPGLYRYRKEFAEYVNKNQLAHNDPWEVRDLFSDHLGTQIMYRSVALTEESKKFVDQFGFYSDAVRSGDDELNIFENGRGWMRKEGSRRGEIKYDSSAGTLEGSINSHVEFADESNLISLTPNKEFADAYSLSFGASEDELMVVYN